MVDPDTGKSCQDQPVSEFQQQAKQSQPNFFSEYVHFLLHNKKWWLVPIVVVLLLMGLLVALSGTGVAPFIYPLF
jgi:hypothetical protein